MAREREQRQRKPKAAAVVPVLFMEGTSEPHFIMMQRKPSKVVAAGKHTLALGGIKEAKDKTIRAAGFREGKEESGLRFTKADIIHTFGYYFKGGFRGNIIMAAVMPHQMQQVYKFLEQVNSQKHNEFVFAEIVSSSHLRENMHNYDLIDPQTTLRVLDIAENLSK